jgi:hypothetical protein
MRAKIVRFARWCGFAGLAAVVVNASAALVQNFSSDTVEHERTIVPFLKQHCQKCHGPEKQKADFRVDRNLPNDFLTRSVAQKWSEVLNKLDTGEMPPKDEPRPASNDVAKVSEWISRERLRGEQARKSCRNYFAFSFGVGGGSLQDCHARKRHWPLSSRQTARKLKMLSDSPVALVAFM